MHEHHRGGCLCGDVRYHTVGRPQHTTICHCTFCQRLTGSAFLIEPIFRSANLVIEQGAPASHEHRSPAHGRRVTVHFCARCGTRIHLSFERFPGFVGVCGGTYDDPHWFKPDRHIFTQTAVRWMIFPPDVTCYRQHAMRLDGTPEDPWQEPVPS